MYQKNITTAALALLDKEAPPQKVGQWKKDGRVRPCITRARVRQLHRLFRYQLAAMNGKLRRAF